MGSRLASSISSVLMPRASSTTTTSSRMTLTTSTPSSPSLASSTSASSSTRATILRCIKFASCDPFLAFFFLSDAKRNMSTWGCSSDSLWPGWTNLFSDSSSRWPSCLSLSDPNFNLFGRLQRETGALHGRWWSSRKKRCGVSSRYSLAVPFLENSPSQRPLLLFTSLHFPARLEDQMSILFVNRHVFIGSDV